MSTWVIGDLQGCWTTFQTLLGVIRFNRKKDRIWLAGDLVNRGPGNLQILRWCVENDAAVTAILGNHDLHLLARAAGLKGPGTRETLDDVLTAPDREDLLAWLRARPLMHVQDGYALVHAGLLPQWTLAIAQEEAERISRKLRKKPDSRLLVPPPGTEPLLWTPDGPRRRISLAALTGLRVVDREGRILRDYKGPPERAPRGTRPWYAAKGRRWKGQATVLFGHWAALGHRRGKDWVSLDSGCVWGNKLTAWRIGDGATVQVPNQEG